jgi:hypothetical protein
VIRGGSTSVWLNKNKNNNEKNNKKLSTILVPVDVNVYFDVFKVIFLNADTWVQTHES